MIDAVNEDIVLDVPSVSPRACAGCTLCCDLMAIKELQKPSRKLCKHCVVGQGCSIYVERPDSCRDWSCGYLSLPDLGEHWHPSKCGMVIHLALGANAGKLLHEGEEVEASIGIKVAKGLEGLWSEEPYWSDVLRLEELAHRNSAWLTVREDHGQWHFDHRVTPGSVAPLYVSNSEMLLRLRGWVLLKAPKSFRGVIEGKVIPAYEAAVRELQLRNATPQLLALQLVALDVIRSCGMDVDKPRRTLRRVRGT